MSLQFVIDGYNLLNSPHLAKKKTKLSNNDNRLNLLSFIRHNKLTGSEKNKILIVFDGFPPEGFQKVYLGADILFSFDKTADERIDRLAEEASSPRSTIIVTDDRDIQIFVKSTGCRVMKTEEFLGLKPNVLKNRQNDSDAPEITHVQMAKINDELRKIWLK